MAAVGRSGARDEREETAKGLGLTLAILGTVFLVALAAQLPDSMALPWLRNQQPTMTAIWPQGWSFFSNAADVETVAAYTFSPAGGPLEVPQLHMAAANAWGLGRSATVADTEVRRLAAGIPDSAWHSCGSASSLADCFAAATGQTLLTDTYAPAVVCGLVGFERSAPRSLGNAPAAGPSVEVAKAQVRCG